MTKVDELIELIKKMWNITAEDEYLAEVGFQSPNDMAIVDKLSELGELLDKVKSGK